MGDAFMNRFVRHDTDEEDGTEQDEIDETTEAVREALRRCLFTEGRTDENEKLVGSVPERMHHLREHRDISRQDVGNCLDDGDDGVNDACRQRRPVSPA